MAAQQQICDNYGPNLDLLPAGTVLGLLVDSGSRLHLYVDGRDQGVAAGGIPQPCYVLIDLYGQCQQVTVVSDGDEVGAARARGDVEKVDVVDGMKEPRWAPPPEAPPPPCPYQALCARFKELLLLPDAFFSPDPPRGRCFCERCHQRRGGDEGGGRGGGRDPPAPLGWCRYGLRPRPRAEPGALWAKWPRAFLGTDAGSVRRALDRGEPVPGPASVLCRPTNEEVGGTAPPPGPPRLVLSPALPYAALEPFATKVHFRDPGSQQALGARVAFEVLLRPGSFRPGPPSLRPPAGLAPPPGLDPAHLEWVTREPGAAVLCGLLVRVE